MVAVVLWFIAGVLILSKYPTPQTQLRHVVSTEESGDDPNKDDVEMQDQRQPREQIQHSGEATTEGQQVIPQHDEEFQEPGGEIS